jgi:DNA uptake protein ComE-like DNA-binding protein
MPVLWRLNTPYMVRPSDVEAKLREGFTREMIVSHPPPVVEESGDRTPPPEGIINVNTCTVAELTALKGIGIATANEIINGRPYESLESLLSDPRIVPHIDKFIL